MYLTVQARHLMDLVQSKLVDEHQSHLVREGKSAESKQVLKVKKEKTCFFCQKPGCFKKDCRKWQATKDGNGSS